MIYQYQFNNPQGAWGTRLKLPDSLGPSKTWWFIWPIPPFSELPPEYSDPLRFPPGDGGGKQDGEGCVSAIWPVMGCLLSYGWLTTGALAINISAGFRRTRIQYAGHRGLNVSTTTDDWGAQEYPPIGSFPGEWEKSPRGGCWQVSTIYDPTPLYNGGSKSPTLYLGYDYQYNLTGTGRRVYVIAVGGDITYRLTTDYGQTYISSDRLFSDVVSTECVPLPVPLPVSQRLESESQGYDFFGWYESWIAYQWSVRYSVCDSFEVPSIVVPPVLPALLGAGMAFAGAFSQVAGVLPPSGVGAGVCGNWYHNLSGGV